MSVFVNLGKQLRAARKDRGLSQSQLASRVGRSVTRISELERDLANDRWGRDRLTLFAEMCDALDLVPMLVPRARVEDVTRVLGHPVAPSGGTMRSAFDDLFVDLDDGADSEG